MKTYKKQNIWYCHPNAGAPGVGSDKPNRAYFLSKEFFNYHDNVNVITASFDHIGGLKTQSRQRFSQFDCDGVNFILAKTPTYKGSLKRIFNMIAYSCQIKFGHKQLVSLCGVPDVIICSSPSPFHYFACKTIAKKYGAKLIFEVRDLWPLSIIEVVGASKLHPLCLWTGFIEKQAYRHADAVVSLLEHADKYMITKGLAQQHYHWIPNGYTPSEQLITPDNDTDYQLLSSLKGQGKFIVGYTGAHGKPNNLDILCEAISHMQNDNVIAILIGDGKQKQTLINRYANAKNIIFMEAKPKHLISSFQLLFDVAFLGHHPKPLYQYGISANKLYEYMYNKVPVLVGQYPANSTILHKHNRGYLFDNNSAKNLQRIIDEVKNQPKQQRLDLGQKNHEYVQASFLYSTLAEKYCQLFDDISSN